jgi:serine/threonine-protein kinase
MSEHLKDLPERAKNRGETTIAMQVPTASAPPSKSIDSVPIDSYQPRPMPATDVSDAPGSFSEVIVPSRATVSSILEQVRRAPADRLEIEARVAIGGMGAIDVAIDRALDRRIAVKTLHGHLRSDDTAVRMFLREARLTGLLDHPHVVPVYDLGERSEDGNLFFTMKLVEGETLAALLQALPRGVRDTATIYMLLDVIAKVCDALAFAHSRGVLHCDVKPANVMVGEFGEVYLMDWGIARLVSAVPASTEAEDGPPPPTRRTMTDQAVIGTPCYMSPEQARGNRKKLDARSDVFLLGATLYELLTHRPPYSSSDRLETLALAAAAAFPNPRKVAGHVAVPLELDRIVMRAMAKNPDDRYPSVSAMKEDLVRFMRGGAEFPRRSFAAGTCIVREGEQGDAAYIVVEGRCEVRKGVAQGDAPVRTLKTIGPGDVFGEMAILTEGPRTASVYATEPTTLLVITSQVLEQELAALKPWMARILTSLASRFREMDTQDRITGPAFPTPARVANQVLMTLTTWGEAQDDGSLAMKWTTLAPELESQLCVPPVSLFSAIARYGIVLDLDADRLAIPNPVELRTRLQADLSPK